MLLICFASSRDIRRGCPGRCFLFSLSSRSFASSRGWRSLFVFLFAFDILGARHFQWPCAHEYSFHFHLLLSVEHIDTSCGRFFDRSNPLHRLSMQVSVQLKEPMQGALAQNVTSARQLRQHRHNHPNNIGNIHTLHPHRRHHLLYSFTPATSAATTLFSSAFTSQTHSHNRPVAVYRKPQSCGIMPCSNPPKMRPSCQRETPTTQPDHEPGQEDMLIENRQLRQEIDLLKSELFDSTFFRTPIMLNPPLRMRG